METGKFKTPSNDILRKRMSDIPDNLIKECPICHEVFFAKQVGALNVCPKCGYGFRITAKKRVEITFDDFEEIGADIVAPSRYQNAKYLAKLEKAKEVTGINESVLTGMARIQDTSFAAGIMDPFFIMGSLGSMTGEKISRLFRLATNKSLPVVMFTSSGGARMQEGIMSLMQMAKVSAAISEHAQAGLFYVVVLCDPTTGGVTASFAMDGDIILAEPHALVGFAGRRVIEQTIRQKPPVDFQQAETVLQHGFIDAIVERKNMKQTLHQLIKLHEA
ncbi:acetyl-CoA carboxylase carboxyltransferase subunit beta [Lentilactobacillus sp. SPB1-3]|uniref:Acetyl-CoA carboxylase carboxyltransferase subunit beta n=1 Tax=Lentilactobacillus terminaliae TaxID=3003483 RepID=A0ACD5DG99_9LACO|nr:acetyl-CoA carboxylase carboxyltransferase subunit beta [Lentilactobacillus sp. SPB1-3]MCZ0976811.1 acetyl-CoA carboxylase carboxyltransferase subunit beta [Lentilactobacillus sp. SPB1-3]